VPKKRLSVGNSARGVVDTVLCNNSRTCAVQISLLNAGARITGGIHNYQRARVEVDVQASCIKRCSASIQSDIKGEDVTDIDGSAWWLKRQGHTLSLEIGGSDGGLLIGCQTPPNNCQQGERYEARYNDPRDVHT